MTAADSAPLVLGVDSSTQSTKVELRQLHTGELVAVGRAAHPPTTPPRSEQDPQAWWQALLDSLDQVASHLPAVVAVAVAGQQHGLVLIDDSGTPLRPAKLWNDTTSAPEAEELTRRLGPEGWAGACGSVPTASFTITKLAWVAAHEPQILARTARVMLPHDYLTWRLTGRHVTDRGDASGTGWWSPAERYEPDLLALAGGPGDLAGRLPEVLGPIEAAGTVTAGDVLARGLGSAVVVGPGTGDNMAGALGLGLGPGDVAVSIGTSGTVYGVSPTATHDETGAVAGFADASGHFLPLVCTLNATKVTDAVARLLGLDHEQASLLALTAEPGAGGLVLVPYFDGERTPNRPDATGALLGLRSDVGRPQLARAAYEGVVCGLLDGLDAMGRVGVVTGGKLLLTGGGARAEAYRRTLADLAGRPVIVPDTDETVATGACVQAAAVVAAERPGMVAARWGLGAGQVVEPHPIDASAVRQAYTAAITQLA
ncbi:MAG: xylulokinase [Acidimicrobiales bacterium]